MPPSEAPSGRKGYWKSSSKGFVIPSYHPGNGTNDVILIVKLPHEPEPHTGVHRMFTTRGQWDQITNMGDLSARRDHYFQWYGLAWDDEDIEDWEWMCREFLEDDGPEGEP